MIRFWLQNLRDWLQTRRTRAPGSGNPLDLENLLDRRPVRLETPELQRFLGGKTILITGAGGSIGSETCRQVMKFCPRRLVMLDRAETPLFEIDRELRDQWVGADLLPVVADICDKVRISQVFSEQRPQVVFHCAAHKHVPMMESNAGEAVKNNVFGTVVVADAASASGAEAFVLVSTDKAVNPSSVMGATKRCAELYVQSLNAASSFLPAGSGGCDPAETEAGLPHATRFVCVRFGNVLGSNGSVVPIFQKQIQAGGPVTVTHPEMRRYFMTIPEASQLVMQAGAMGKGGEIFVLDMGLPVSILELARRMIRNRGLTPEEDIGIRFIGIRPGEKLREELVSDGEHTLPTSHPRIRVCRLPGASYSQVQRMLQILAEVINADPVDVRCALQTVLPEYRPAGHDSQMHLAEEPDRAAEAA